MRLIIIFINILFFSLSLFGDILVDEFNSVGNWAAISSSDAGAEVESASGYTGTGMKLISRFYNKASSSDWCSFYRQFKYIDLSKGDKLKFYYKYTGVDTDLYFNINNVEIYILSLNNMSSFDVGVIDLSLFSAADLSKTEKIKFVVKNKNMYSGRCSLSLTKLQLFRSTDISEKTGIIDDFSDSDDSNTLIGGQFLYTAPSSNNYNVVTTNSSFDYMTLSYTRGTIGSEVKWIIKLSGSEYTNLLEYDYLKLKVKCNVDNINWGVVLQDNEYHNVTYNLNSNKDDFFNTWQEIKIPIEYFSEIKLKHVYELQFTFYKTDSVTNSVDNFKIYVDDLKFYRESKAAGIVKTVDSMDYYNAKSPWVKWGDNNNSIELSSGEGINGNKALKMDFNLVDGMYALIEREFYLNLSKGILQFKAKTAGGNNDLKIQIANENSDGKIIFFRNFYRIIGTTSEWVTLKIYPQDWKFAFTIPDGMENTALDLKKITQLEFVVGKNEDATNSTCVIDDLKIVSDDNYTVADNKDNLIESFHLNNMKFSPDGDGENDTVIFSFKLKERAKVDLYIFNLKGELVRTIFSYNSGKYYESGENSIVWDGSDNDGNILNNGVYIFKFNAVSENSSDTVKTVLAIKR